MAGVSIKLQAQDLERAIQTAVTNCHDMRPAWAQVGEYMLGSVESNFDAEGRPDRWEPLKQKTLLAKAGGKRQATKRRGGFTARAQRIIGGNKILTASRRLRRSMTYEADSGGVSVGTNVEYAATHQFGRTSGRGAPIPARPFLVIQPEDEQEIGKILEQHIAGAFK